MNEMGLANLLATITDGKDGNEMFGGSWVWIIFLFFIFMFCGGNGFGNNGKGATVEDLSAAFNFNELQAGVYNIQKGICDSTYALNESIKDCCCTTNRNIDSVKYEMAQGFCSVNNTAALNTRDLIASQVASTQRIVDLINSNEVQSLRDKNTEYALQLSQQAQTANLLHQLRPCPVPAYPSCNPWATGAYNGCGC